MMTASEIGDGLRLEEIVDQRAEQCRQSDDQREVAQEWLLLELRPRSLAVWSVRDRRSAGGRSPSDGRGAHDTESADKRQQRKQRALRQQGGDSLSAHAP